MLEHHIHGGIERAEINPSIQQAKTNLGSEYARIVSAS